MRCCFNHFWSFILRGCCQHIVSISSWGWLQCRNLWRSHELFVSVIFIKELVENDRSTFNYICFGGILNTPLCCPFLSIFCPLPLPLTPHLFLFQLFWWFFSLLLPTFFSKDSINHHVSFMVLKSWWELEVILTIGIFLKQIYTFL